MVAKVIRGLLAISICITPNAIGFTQDPAADLKPVAVLPTSKTDRHGESGFRALYTVDRDGSNVQFLAAAPGMISSATPEWSHDGKKIAFDALPSIDAVILSRIFVFVMDGSGQGEIRDLGPGNVPSWSPDDRQLAFMINEGSPAHVPAGIWVMNADGTGRRHLCQGWYPRWSPDGSEICIDAYFEQAPQLHFYDVKTGKIRKILGEAISVEFGGATWSPDGKRAAFIGNMDDRQHIAVVDVDGDLDSLALLYSESDRSRVLVGPPSWSPDGKEIVFAIQDLEQAKGQARRWLHTYLYKISAETPSTAQLLEPKKVGLINRGMSWSPDGRKIIFSSER